MRVCNASLFFELQPQIWSWGIWGWNCGANDLNLSVCRLTVCIFWLCQWSWSFWSTFYARFTISVSSKIKLGLVDRYFDPVEEVHLCEPEFLRAFQTWDQNSSLRWLVERGWGPTFTKFLVCFFAPEVFGHASCIETMTGWSWQLLWLKTCYVPGFLYCTGLTVAVGLLFFNNVLLIIVLDNNYN